MAVLLSDSYFRPGDGCRRWLGLEEGGRMNGVWCQGESDRTQGTQGSGRSQGCAHCMLRSVLCC